MTRLTVPFLIAVLIVAGCGRFGDSAFSPRSWGSSVPETLAPEGGYAQTADQRASVPQILGAEWQPLPDGRLLVLRGFAPVKGYHSAALVTQRPQPSGRLAPDADGVLRLRFVAEPPLPTSPAARLPANPATDTITVALPVSLAQLSRLTAIEVQGGDRTIRLGR